MPRIKYEIGDIVSGSNLAEIQGTNLDGGRVHARKRCSPVRSSFTRVNLPNPYL
jgi:hypothetical protein